MTMNLPSSPILPGTLTPFVGRQVELQQLLDMLRDPSIRLVTLLGAGGIGKTRLALETASNLQVQFQNGVYFVPLAQLATVDELLPALAGTLDVYLPPGGDLQQSVLDHLVDKQALLILDNFEHLLEEAMLINDILIAGHQVKVIVTSREKLSLEAETLYHLDGLKLPPESVQDIEQYDAVRLFLQKARQVRPDFSLNATNIPAVIRICRLVDGNPLGILLAAASVEHFSPDEIFDEINNSLDFLTSTVRDTDPRHTCMRAVFDSSYRQLDENYRATFRKLACFRGGFDLAAAKAIARTDLKTLIALVNKSLLSRDPDSSRYDLHELLRQYADEELAIVDERENMIAAHAHYYMKFAREREPRLYSPEQTMALDEIQANFDNIRQAFSVAIECRDFSTIRSVLPSLYVYCDMRSKFYEGESLFRLASEGLAPRDDEAPDPTWALSLLSWYDMQIYIERLESFNEIASQAQSCLDQAIRIHDPQGTAASYVLLGAISEGQGNFKTAILNFKKGLRSYLILDDPYWVNMRIGLAHLKIQEYTQAIQAFENCLKRGQEMGERVRIGWSLLNIGVALLEQGKLKEAETYLEQSLVHFTKVGTTIGEVWAYYYAGMAALDQGDVTCARGLAQTAGDIAHQLHSKTWIQKSSELLQRIDPQTTISLHVEAQDDEAFSSRELEVLQMLKSELSGPEIARRLIISLNTVRYHTKNIYQKLGVNNRLEAIQKAKELGL
jgi:predicted ATPase/DNA-binding CsgD family transcriptional regulator